MLILGRNRCAQAPRTGTCKSILKRFYFDNHRGECRLFVYTGCGGNENNFETLQECQEACLD